MLFKHRLRDHRHHFFAMISDYARVNRRVEWNRISQMIAVMRTVGRMQIDGEMRIPAVKQSDQRLSFGRLELDVIAIQIEPFCILSHTYSAERTVLCCA